MYGLSYESDYTLRRTVRLSEYAVRTTAMAMGSLACFSSLQNKGSDFLLINQYLYVIFLVDTGNMVLSVSRESLFVQYCKRREFTCSYPCANVMSQRNSTRSTLWP